MKGKSEGCFIALCNPWDSGIETAGTPPNSGRICGDGMGGNNCQKAISRSGDRGGVFPCDRAGDQPTDPCFASGTQASPDDAVVLKETDCVVSHVIDRLNSVVEKPGGLCHACRRELAGLRDLLLQLTQGTAERDILDAISLAADRLHGRGHCETARRAVLFVVTALRYFPGEFRMHAVNRHCEAGVCRRLLPAPCQVACPAGIDIPTYLALTAAGRYEEALEIIRKDNPFAWVCGLICPHPCEKACIRSHLDEPINIRYLKAFVSDWTANRKAYPTAVPPSFNGKKVAVVGSGPAGLTAAHYLALEGYRVTIFEALPKAGGLLVFGIPEYRLPRDIVAREIASIQSMGVEIRTGIAVGKDITLQELRGQGYEAFFLGIGAHQGYKLQIEGEDHFPQVYDAIGFLRQVNLGVREKPAEKVVVVGGGNSAMDAARTCLRLGCKSVQIAYRRTRAEMPANPQEVDEAMEEGVQFHFLAVPVRIGGDNGQVGYLECLQSELGKPDASGRRRPVPIDGSNFRIEAGAVIAAIGQQPDFHHFCDEMPCQITPRNLIVTEPPSTRTGAPDVFAGGDAVTGPATVVQAIAAGKQAALDIHHYLTGSIGTPPVFRVHKRCRIPFSPMPASEKISRLRIPVPVADVEDRSRNFEPVELAYTDEEARREANRCLRCDVCIRCGACERVCREGMRVHALDFRQISGTESILGDYHRAQERCIACGACALACPTGAIEFLEDGAGREVRLCGTILNRLEVQKCHSCGGPFVPSRYLDYVTERSDAVTGRKVLRRLCPACARESRARNFVKT